MQFSAYIGGMDLAENQSGGEENWRSVSLGHGALLTKKQARIWALVLDSRSVPCCINSDGDAWLLLVPPEHYDTACRELLLYEEKNRLWPPSFPPPARMIENTLSTVSFLVLLATFHNLTTLGLAVPGRGVLDFVEIGSAHSARIISGEWWRAVTALTLHSGLPHLLGNLTIGGFFITLLCREIGSGLAWCLLLGTGIFGNLLNAWLQTPDHHSIGASTAVFGAVGLMAAVSAMRYRNQLRRRWFIPVAAGLALLAILGTEGKNTDLGAHLFGFGFGVIIGLLTEKLTGKFGRPGNLLNLLLVSVSAGAVLLAWWIALDFGMK